MAYVRTVIVSPVGTPSQNGAALVAALAAITDASAASPVLVKIEPGTFDVTPASVVMKQYVDIEGSGRHTRLQRAGSPTQVIATVLGASNAELRQLTVVNVGGDVYAEGIYSQSASPRLSSLWITVSGGTAVNHGIRLAIASAEIRDVTIDATGALASAIVQESGSNTTVRNLRATVIGNGGAARGFAVHAGSTASLTDVTINVIDTPNGIAQGVLYVGCATGTTLSNVAVTATGAIATAIDLQGCDNATLVNVTAVATGAPHQSTGVFSSGANLTVRGSILSASGPAAIGLRVASPAGTAAVDASRIVGASSTIFNETAVPVKVGASQLAGGPVQGPASCVAAYDENYTSAGLSACP